MAYANEGNLENYLTVDIDNSLSAQVEEWSDAVDLYINKYTGKNFNKTTAEVRYFDGNGLKEIHIDDFVTLSSVEVLESTSDDVTHSLTEGKAEDYITYPYNDAVKFKLVLTPTSTVQAWPTGSRRLKITGEWGTTNVPVDIILAATMLLAGVIEKGMKGGSVLSESLGDYTVTYKLVDDISSVMGVKEILDTYKIWEM